MQLAFLSYGGAVPSLLRLGNRQGKSTCGCAELIFRARGRHPYKEVKEAPARLALVCMSMTQSIEIQRVLWELLGGPNNTDLKEGVEYSPRTGFRGHKPVVEFKNGSTITIYSNGQGAEALAGSEYDFILLDEPPSQIVYDECLMRVANTGGSLGLTLTPINGPPLPWLKELVESGAVKEFHSKLTPESQTSPLTGKLRTTKDGRPWDQEYIDELTARTNPVDAPVRIHGEWESRSEGQYFRCFDKAKHTVSRLPTSQMQFAIGIDYAASDREMGMCAVITGITSETGESETYNQFWVIDEIIVPGTHTMEQFAEAIYNRLGAIGLKWHQIDFAFGDKPVQSRYETASNIQLQRHLAKLYGISSQGMKPKILSVKRGKGASNASNRTKDIRCRWMYQELSRDRVKIHYRCKTLIKAMETWDYGDRHNHKDVLDAFMYGLQWFWKPDSRFTGNVPTVRFK